MKISQLIIALTKIIQEDGDMEVSVAGHPGERGVFLEEDCLDILWDEGAGKTLFFLF